MMHVMSFKVVLTCRDLFYLRNERMCSMKWKPCDELQDSMSGDPGAVEVVLYNVQMISM